MIIDRPVSDDEFDLLLARLKNVAAVLGIKDGHELEGLFLALEGWIATTKLLRWALTRLGAVDEIGQLDVNTARMRRMVSMIEDRVANGDERPESPD